MGECNLAPSGRKHAGNLATIADPAQLQVRQSIDCSAGREMVGARTNPAITSQSRKHMSSSRRRRIGVARWANCENVASAELPIGIAAIRRTGTLTAPQKIAIHGEVFMADRARSPSARLRRWWLQRGSTAQSESGRKNSRGLSSGTSTAATRDGSHGFTLKGKHLRLRWHETRANQEANQGSGPGLGT